MSKNPWDNVSQPTDDADAGNPWFYLEMYREFQKGLEALLFELERHQNIVQLLGLKSSPYENEVSRIREMVEWGKKRLESGKQPDHAEITVPGASYGSLRYLKAAIRYQAFLVEERRREHLANFKIVPRSVLQSFDARIAQLHNIGETGKLGGLRPAEVLFELIEAEHGAAPAVPERSRSLSSGTTSLVDIPIVDQVLRERCLRLLGAIDGAGSAEQLDSVVREMSVVLEDRVRELSGFSGKGGGAELFASTMAREPFLLRFSDEKNIQDAAHFFFRGYSGLVRNEVMHRLVKSYTKERVLQLLGTVDYLLFLLSNAQATGADEDK